MLLDQYTEILRKIYGNHLKTVILYGSYARGNYKADSDIDIMILLDLLDMDIKQYRHELSGETFDFNMDHDLDIKPIAKSQQHFQNWVDVYPFYANVKKEGVKLFESLPVGAYIDSVKCNINNIKKWEKEGENSWAFI